MLCKSLRIKIHVCNRKAKYLVIHTFNFKIQNCKLKLLILKFSLHLLFFSIICFTFVNRM